MCGGCNGKMFKSSKYQFDINTIVPEYSAIIIFQIYEGE